ncbi:trehalose synthase [Seonamhaeicola sp. ML3]|uniref:maltokinase N-terminal cap-like domain-containing protein n=1 Tax=Seonamhaeicola sp. ML3 TaxID=2937786 RepID=UPI0020104E2A|nr:trehalose synthase [Seonamhaeicola sp. ML3]
MTKTTTRSQTDAVFVINEHWEQLLNNKAFTSAFLSDVLENYIVKQRWYGGKASRIKYIELSEYFRLQHKGEVYYGLILEVNYHEAFYHHYFLPIAFVTDEAYVEDSAILPIELSGIGGHIIDATYLEAFRRVIFNRLVTAEPNDKTPVRYHKNKRLDGIEYETSRFMGLEQSNTSIVYNNKYVLKFFRRIYADKNPDYEMSRFLSEKKEFKNTPAYLGSINIEDSDSDIITIALMQEMIPNEGDAWDYMLKELHKLFMHLKETQIDVATLSNAPLFSRLNLEDISPEILNWIGLSFFKKIQTLAKRTAEMHIALGAEFEETAFDPARFNSDYEVWLKNRLLYQFQNRLNTVENNLHKLEGLTLKLAQEFLDRKNDIRKRFVKFDWTKLKGERIRVHGDYHLGQILVHKDDFYILDFEGEPESTIRDRKVKQPPLKDVSGLFRSFHYAIYSCILNHGATYGIPRKQLFKAADVLFNHITGVFLDTYVALVREANLNIGYEKERNFILKYTMLEKAVYEIGYELNSRPQWAVIPLKGISNIINN